MARTNARNAPGARATARGSRGAARERSRLGLAPVLALLLGCARAEPLPVTASNLVGTWRFDRGQVKEQLSFEPGGSFDGRIYRTGFLARTLSQGEEAEIRGSWALAGGELTLRIEESSVAKLAAESHSYEVLELTEARMTVLDAESERIDARRVVTLGD